MFSDTGTFLAQLLIPFMNWDKPWIYGPVLVLMSLKLTLWLPAVAQGACVSWVLWRVQGAFRPPSPRAHLGLCLLLAAGSAAPWFAAMLMPDILAPLTVLTLFLLAFDARPPRWPMFLLATFAIAAHLTHLVIGAACVAAVLVLRPRAAPFAAAPLAAALALLLATNFVGHGRIGISPHGAVFGLARLAADGPADAYLARVCPDPGLLMCAWVGRMPSDADEFLWDPNGPVWTYPGGPIALAPEASHIIVGTILAQPWAVARTVVANGWTQLSTIRFETELGGQWLDDTVGLRLAAYFQPSEQARYLASLQRTGMLRTIAAEWQDALVVLLVSGTATSLGLMLWARRRDPLLFAFAALIATGVLANALAAGALSGPHGRYQARIAWLVLLPPALAILRARERAHPARQGGPNIPASAHAPHRPPH